MFTEHCTVSDLPNSFAIGVANIEAHFNVVNKGRNTEQQSLFLIQVRLSGPKISWSAPDTPGKKGSYTARKGSSSIDYYTLFQPCFARSQQVLWQQNFFRKFREEEQSNNRKVFWVSASTETFQIFGSRNAIYMHVIVCFWQECHYPGMTTRSPLT